jgi:V-type H+-transporting ATPase proteolipid subunit
LRDFLWLFFRLFVGLILILIFAEALALYGLIVALIVGLKAASG